MADAPYVGDLLTDSPSNWGRWGSDDEVGALNFLDAAEVMRGAATIKKGAVFTLQRLSTHGSLPLPRHAAGGGVTRYVTR